MIFISHRGNISGENRERENSPDFILEAMAEDYIVEIDVRLMSDGALWLGHDVAQYKLENKFILDNKKKLLIHCKNISSLYRLRELEDEFKLKLHFFYHETDNATITSQGKFIIYPGKRPLGKNSIAMLPEATGIDYNYNMNDMKICWGICSDNISLYRKLHQNESRV